MSSSNDQYSEPRQVPGASSELSNDVFMKEFKRFKLSKDPKNDPSLMGDILCLDQVNDNNLDELKIKKINYNFVSNEEYDVYLRNYGLTDPKEWMCYELNDLPGLILIRNPFKPGYQRYFIKQCLNDYHNLPNKTNLDLHTKRDLNIWTESVRKKDFYEFNKLRWATIGYHYDWTNKIYNENDFTQMPEDVHNLSRLIASAIGHANYKPEAGIVNYYHLNSTLSAHQDYSELFMGAPLISLSLGSSAIFLIGSTSKSIKPRAICLQSGEVCIMSAQARLAFHAVPKIFQNYQLRNVLDYKAQNGDEMLRNSKFYVNDEEWSNYYEYIKINRVNLNIRQVYE